MQGGFLFMSRGHEGGLEMAEALLRRAAEEEDALIASYIEPPRIPNPSRQCLAWLLLHRAKYKCALTLCRQ